MKHFSITRTPAALALLFGASGLAHGACWIGPETNASSVQNDSGQGNYDCSVLTSPAGTTLVNLRTVLMDGQPAATVVFDDSPNGTVRWEVQSDAYGRALFDVFLVSTNNKGKGSRCNYMYSNGPVAEDGPVTGAGLGAIDAGSVLLDSVSVCGDPTLLTLEPPPPAPPPEPTFITTVGDGCDATVTYSPDGVADTTLVPEVTVGFTAGKDGNTPPQIAVCASGDQVRPQVECAPNPPARSYDGSLCSATGELSLETCAPVEWDRGDIKYCWYYENQVCDATGTSPFCTEGRTWGTFIPRPKIDTLDASIDVTQGSTRYTICIYGRCYYQ